MPPTETSIAGRLVATLTKNASRMIAPPGRLFLDCRSIPNVGIYVEDVKAESPLVKEMNCGDVILAVDGEPTNQYTGVKEFANSLKKKNGSERVLTVALEEKFILQVLITALTNQASRIVAPSGRLYLECRSIPDVGICVDKVKLESPLVKKINCGDVILEVDGEPTNKYAKVKDFAEMMKKPGERILTVALKANYQKTKKEIKIMFSPPIEGGKMIKLLKGKSILQLGGSSASSALSSTSSSSSSEISASSSSRHLAPMRVSYPASYSSDKKKDKEVIEILEIDQSEQSQTKSTDKANANNANNIVSPNKKVMDRETEFNETKRSQTKCADKAYASSANNIVSPNKEVIDRTESDKRKQSQANCTITANTSTSNKIVHQTNGVAMEREAEFDKREQSQVKSAGKVNVNSSNKVVSLTSSPDNSESKSTKSPSIKPFCKDITARSIETQNRPNDALDKRIIAMLKQPPEGRHVNAEGKIPKNSNTVSNGDSSRTLNQSTPKTQKEGAFNGPFSKAESSFLDKVITLASSNENLPLHGYNQNQVKKGNNESSSKPKIIKPIRSERNFSRKEDSENLDVNGFYLVESKAQKEDIIVNSAIGMKENEEITATTGYVEDFKGKQSSQSSLIASEGSTMNNAIEIDRTEKIINSHAASFAQNGNQLKADSIEKSSLVSTKRDREHDGIQSVNKKPKTNTAASMIKEVDINHLDNSKDIALEHDKKEKEGKVTIESKTLAVKTGNHLLQYTAPPISCKTKNPSAQDTAQSQRESLNNAKNKDQMVTGQNVNYLPSRLPGSNIHQPFYYGSNPSGAMNTLPFPGAHYRYPQFQNSYQPYRDFAMHPQNMSNTNITRNLLHQSMVNQHQQQSIQNLQNFQNIQNFQNRKMTGMPIHNPYGNPAWCNQLTNIALNMNGSSNAFPTNQHSRKTQPNLVSHSYNSNTFNSGPNVLKSAQQQRLEKSSKVTVHNFGKSKLSREIESRTKEPFSQKPNDQAQPEPLQVMNRKTRSPPKKRVDECSIKEKSPSSSNSEKGRLNSAIPSECTLFSLGMPVRLFTSDDLAQMPVWSSFTADDKKTETCGPVASTQDSNQPKITNIE